MELGCTMLTLQRIYFEIIKARWLWRTPTRIMIFLPQYARPYPLT